MPKGIPKGPVIRQICSWCSLEVSAGQDPPIWTTCPSCRAIASAYSMQPPCPSCGARQGRSVSGIVVKDGHRDNCITRATPVGPKRRE